MIILDKNTGNRLRQRFTDAFVNKEHPRYNWFKEDRVVYFHDMLRDGAHRFVKYEDAIEWLRLLPKNNVYLMWDLCAGKACYENDDITLEVFSRTYDFDAVLEYNPSRLCDDIEYDNDIVRQHKDWRHMFPDDLYVFDDSMEWFVALTHNEFTADFERRVCYSNISDIPEVTDVSMNTGISIYAKGLHFLGETKDETERDLCVHGTVHMQLGDDMISSGDITWNAGASALRFLRSLFADHRIGEGDGHMIPCCGHFMIPSEDGQNVTVAGCNNGVDFDVIREGVSVKIRTEDGIEYSVSYADYRREVISFATQIESFYGENTERVIEDDFERDGYTAFRTEFGNLMKTAKENGIIATPTQHRFLNKVRDGDKLVDLGCFAEMFELSHDIFIAYPDKGNYSQAVCLRTACGKIYSTVIPNAIDENHPAERELLSRMKNEGNTSITEILCNWGGSPEFPSYDFREMILELDPINANARILLRGRNFYHTRTVSETMK